MCKRTNICLNHEIYLKLKDRGKFGESFSELVSRLLEQLERIDSQSEDRRGGK